MNPNQPSIFHLSAPRRPRFGLLVGLALILITLLAAARAGQAQAPEVTRVMLPMVVGLNLTIDLQPFATGLDLPLAIVNNGDERLFVVEKPGRVRIVEPDGAVLPEPFLDISDQVETLNWEQGMLGLAFHPNFAENGLFFITYTAAGTDEKNAPTRLSRFQVGPDNPDQALAGSEQILLTIPQFSQVHHGGDLHFGPDGYLYMSVGDSGVGTNAQDLMALQGSLLRLDVNTAVGEGYLIPPTNPYAGTADARGEIWAKGLRNPWRFSFDTTGQMYIGDVGANSWEEVNVQPNTSVGGENYGWPCTEGPDASWLPDTCIPGSELTLPVFAYTHEFGRCAVTGGQVYNGAAFPTLQGLYFFADLCDGTFWGMPTVGELGAAQVLGTFPTLLPAAFGTDAAGELYVAAHGPGVIYRVVAGP